MEICADAACRSSVELGLPYKRHMTTAASMPAIAHATVPKMMEPLAIACVWSSAQRAREMRTHDLCISKQSSQQQPTTNKEAQREKRESWLS